MVPGQAIVPDHQYNNQVAILPYEAGFFSRGEPHAPRSGPDGLHFSIALRTEHAGHLEAYQTDAAGPTLKSHPEVALMCLGLETFHRPIRTGHFQLAQSLEPGPQAGKTFATGHQRRDLLNPAPLLVRRTNHLAAHLRHWINSRCLAFHERRKTHTSRNIRVDNSEGVRSPPESG